MKAFGGSGLWRCEICRHENPDSEDTCEECGSLRDEPGYDQIADEDDE